MCRIVHTSRWRSWREGHQTVIMRMCRYLAAGPGQGGADTVHVLPITECADEIIPGLWMSGMPDPDWDLDGWGIRLVVSLSEHLPPHAARRFEWATSGDAAGDGRIVFLHWPFVDGPLPDRSSCELVAGTVVAALRVGWTVLVHCQEGRNRSGLIVALVVRQIAGCSGADAVELVRSRRYSLSNREFVAALAQLPPVG